MQYTEKIKQNAQKFAYLVKAYPEKSVTEVIGLFQLGPIDINTAIWAAVDLGYITEVDQEQFLPAPEGEDSKLNPHFQHADPKKLPKAWDFGPVEAELESALTYAFKKLNAEEKDLEENYLSNWLGGYATHDSLIAVKRLLETNVLHEYQIEDGENEYLFYSLKENAGKNWGQKQFKINPLTDKPNEPEAPAKPDAPAAPKTKE